MPAEQQNKTRQEREQALKDAHASYSERLLRLANKILKDPATAQDIVAEVFVKLWERDFDFKSPLGKAAVMNYLLKTVKNDCIMELRRFARQKIADETFANAFIDDGADLEIQVFKAELLDKVLEFTKALPPELMEIWLLRYVAKKNHDEVAELLGIPKNEVYVRVRRLKRLLKKELGPVFMRVFLFLSLLIAYNHQN